MYKLINIFEKQDKRLVIYRCFKRLNEEAFYVQSADFFSYPIRSDLINESNLQLLELFLDDEITNRGEPSSSISEAIDNFKEYFNN